MVEDKKFISHFISFISFTSHINQEEAVSAFSVMHLYVAAPSVEEEGDLS